MKKKILIVDDVAANIHMLSLMLKKDYSIIAATSGKKAIELANKHPKPDLILLDILMPEMDGYEVCKILKNSTDTQNIPVIFLSSLSDITEQEKALRNGGNDYLVKPVTREVILNKVQTQIKLSNYHDTLNSLCKGNSQMKNKIAKILIVDDAPQNIQVAVEILKSKYTVSVATSGEKALSLLDEGLNPDLILLDIVMPGMDGFEICMKLKSNLRYCNIPIIFLTVLENEHDMVKGLELGAVDYVTKPFEPKVLKARVDSHVKLKMYQDELLQNIKEKDDILIKQSKLATLGEMFENITHQWKQPLSVISMISSTIKLEKDIGTLDDKSLDKLLNSVDDSVKHLFDTVDNFRDFLIRDNPKEYFKMNDVVNSTLKLLDSKIKYESITINIDLDFVELLNYKNDLIQVLMNIFTNSIHVLKELEDDKIITINSEIREDNFILIIRDNGGGISDEIIDSICDKYFSTKKKEESSGLGLYMSRKIIEDNMDGKLEIVSGEGEAIFKIILPLSLN
jgi:CheY-like chemotaxis protein/anti-sigma regulatory factor (Ser/Thr protein kinase)